jgi:hypothetical protein
VIDVPGSPSLYSFAQTGADVTIYDPLGNALFVLDQYSLQQGLYIV